MPEPPPHRTRRPPSAKAARAEHSARIRVLVADSHDITLAGTCAVLGHTPHIKVVGRATTAAGALAAANRHAIDLALVELLFADGKGIDLCRRIRSSFPNTQVLILTGAIDEESALSVLRGGASGILVKSVGGDGLVRAIEAVYGGHMMFDRRIFQPLITHLCSLSVQACGKARAELSDQEHRVMSLVAEGKTNKEIAITLGLSNKTVKNQLSHLYGKLQVTRRAQATKMFIERTRATGAIGLAEFGCPLIPPGPLSPG